MPTSNEIRSALSVFLDELYKKKSAEAEKKKSATTDEKKRQSIDNDLAQHHPQNWIQEKAIVFAKQLKFGTHLSKHIHSDSKGDNVYFSAENKLPENLCGSQSVHSDDYLLDATGNAAALPLAKFFDIAIGQTTLKQLLLQDNPAVHSVFADNEQQSLEYCRIFQAALKAENPNPKTDERNKQLLWFCPDEKEENRQYQVLVPLYPVALTHCLYRKVDTVKKGEQARRENKPYSHTYATLRDLAVVKLGGNNPQNLSQINSRQSGRHFLLPSMPPQFSAGAVHFSRHIKSFFCHQLVYHTEIERLFTEVVESSKKNFEIRENRRQALDLLCATVLEYARTYRQFPAGWTDDYALESPSQIYWLDPNHQRFATPEHIPANWQENISKDFAFWLEKWFKEKFPKHKAHFNDPEFHYFFKTFATALLLGDER